ncbi:MAG TPA: Xaa-Pro dipeptidyl-peptidase [Cryomorphaceae bacterium]|jgi:X-Pro dipeptidyl-peptidase|nr:MAG: X-prolyl-dipeptidyl aminopeptidase [Cryomorphaceae bacterium BACL7 MAG-120910-bin2]KRO69332.1 MAG: X-prolyl-dipeptidyl aminopeptidase [Cryomorphaceae bacterium BACL7 MAG-120322-bin74]KRO83334.1 MAG: X-prolyl-dipeptidyl aminopeptidase [Cryomorphaceae bacterium BACL7 MAG-121220-bin83]HAB32322.1 Xaa-Pro dipeptidyl-peptidase [Cryomorphaceae bacterium]
MKIFKPLCVLGLTLSLSSLQGQEAPFFKEGQAQIVPAFENSANWIREDLWVEADFDTDGDGRLDRMHVDVTRPARTNDGLQLPVIYESSPYYAGTAGNDRDLFWNVAHELGEVPEPPRHAEVVRKGQRPTISNSQVYTWVPRGFIVVHSSSPGTGLSDGSPTVGGDNESLAPKAVIEWLAGRDNGYKERTGDEKVYAYWSTGKVGMTGTSYNGTIPLAAATTGVEALKAIIPIAPNTSYYHYYRSNGLVRSPGGYLGEDIDVLYEFIHSGEESKRAFGNKTIRDELMRVNMDRATGDYNDFWAGRDYLNDMAPMRAALLMAHGLNDWNVMPEHSYRIYNKAREMGLPVQIYYHQDGHGGSPPMEMMNKWFTRYLFGIENGVENDPRSWIVREGESRNAPIPYADYPNPAAQPVVLHLTKGGKTKGKLTTRKPSRKKEKLVDNVSFSGESLAMSTTSNHRLLYVTPILQEEVHLSGLASLSVRLACSKPAANLSIWLVSLPWNTEEDAAIYDNIISRGWADPQNHESITTSESLIPGKFYTVQFDLQPDDQIIPAGQQIGLMIFSSDQAFTLHPEPGTTLKIDLKQTQLTLPIIGGMAAYTFSTK